MKQFMKTDLVLEGPASTAVLSRRARDYALAIYAKKAGNWELISQREPCEQTGWSIIEASIVEGEKISFSGAFSEEGSESWTIEGELYHKTVEGISFLVEAVTYRYSGNSPTTMQGFRDRFKVRLGDKPFLLVPGFTYFLAEVEEEKDDDLRRRVVGRAGDLWNIRTSFCSTPLAYFYGNEIAYGLAIPPHLNSLMFGLEFGKSRDSFVSGATYPFRETAFGDEQSKQFLEVMPGESFSFPILHFVSTGRGFNAYSEFLKVWYRLYGDHGKYNQWCSPAQTGRLMKKGFLVHYDRELAILYDTKSFPDYDARIFELKHRGMTNGWTSGGAAAYHMLRLGLHLADEVLLSGAESVLDNIARSVTPCGFYCSKFDEVDKKWHADLTWWKHVGPDGTIAATPISETTCFMLKAYQVLKEKGQVKQDWLSSALSNLNAVCKAAKNGKLGSFYHPNTGSIAKNTSLNMDWVAALSMGYTVTSDPLYLKTAEEAAGYYDDNFLSIGLLPGDPPDNASYPCSESSYHSLRGYLELYMVTGRARWLKCAETSAHSVLLWKCAWNVPIPEETELGRSGFKSIGLDKGVDPNIHPYGGMTASLFLVLWRLTKDSYYLHRAIDTARGALQLICRYDGQFGGKAGMLTEQLYITPWPEVSKLGKMMKLSHAAPLAWAMHASLVCKEDFGGIVVDWTGRTVGCLEFVELLSLEKSRNQMVFEIFNPWPEKVSTDLCVYDSPLVSVEQDDTAVPLHKEQDRFKGTVEIESKTKIRIRIVQNKAAGF